MSHNLSIKSPAAKILVLVGATGDGYVSGLEEFLEKYDHVWSGWTYRILPRDIEQLERQKKELGYFRLYLHYIKDRGGSGEVEAIALVDDWITDTEVLESPEPKYTRQDEIDYYNENPGTPPKAWLRIIEIKRPNRFIETRKLTGYYNGKNLNPSTLQSRFAPVIDILGPQTLTISEEEFLKDEERVEKKIQKSSDEELGHKLRQNQGPVLIQPIIGERFVRDPYVAEFAKRKAKGKCQLCKDDAPFKDGAGIPYLEEHHITWLSRRGKDTTENVVALCPNCHRRMHILDLETDKILLRKIAYST